jgi:hypothetical protein
LPTKYTLFLKDVQDAPKEILRCRDEASNSFPLLLEHIRSDQKWSEEIKKLGKENGPIFLLKSALEELQAIVEEPRVNKHGARTLMLLESLPDRTKYAWVKKEEVKNILDRIEPYASLVDIALDFDQLYLLSLYK